jgi:hypothetical protein
VECCQSFAFCGQPVATDRDKLSQGRDVVCLGDAIAAGDDRVSKLVVLLPRLRTTQTDQRSYVIVGYLRYALAGRIVIPRSRRWCAMTVRNVLAQV